MGTEEVKKHDKEADIWLIIGNAKNGGPKVYDVTNYLNDHPGGNEVLLDLGGQNADEFFEDIGHSDDARKELKELCIGTLKLTEEEKKAALAEKESKSAGGINPMVIILVVLIAIALGYFQLKKP